MKKFIIVIIFVFLIAFLISFNYLLWDREQQLESYQDLSNAKNLSIDTLGEKINNLDQQNKELTNKITALEDENSELRRKAFQLNSENQTLLSDSNLKKDFIVMLKSNLSVEPFQVVLQKWVEAVNSKDYAQAMTLVSKTSKDKVLSSEDIFKNTYQNEVKTISLKSSKLFTDLTDNEHLLKIQFEVQLEINKPEAASDDKNEISSIIYKNGENIKFVTMEIDDEAGEWRISELSDKP